ncbi:MAG: prenyltransferase/squalene oxidase repeat-containing protein [Pirellulaceae bacterium]
MYCPALEKLLLFVLAVSVLCANPMDCAAQQTSQRQQMVAKAIEYMKLRGQSPSGAISPKMGVGVTALGATALIKNGVSIADPSVAKALKLVEESAKPDGGIYAEGSRLMMYETSVAILCLQTANENGRYDALLKKAAGFLKGQQFDEEDSIEPSDMQYGGAGYGGKSRPDLSNTAFFIEALSSLGNPENDEAIAKALTFVSRCQNLESQYNTSEDAAKINDGGFYYTVMQDGVSAAGEAPDGGLRSYGSMTYSGFKSMLYAGLEQDDPRVKAAMDWIRKNYTVKENPGLRDAGLYYYYHLFAKALDVSGIDKLVDDAGVEHDWRAELVSHLASLQAADGSWTNSNTRWMEGDPNLSTTFCLLALSHCGE